MGFVLNSLGRDPGEEPPMSEYQYDQDGYLVQEGITLYPSLAGPSRLTLKHTYQAGNRVRTDASYLRYPSTTPQLAVVTYEYDLQKGNPNLPIDDLDVFGGQSPEKRMFVQYRKYHYSLYGKTNRNLVTRASVTKASEPERTTTYAYEYTFDVKERVASVTAIAKYFGYTSGSFIKNQRLFAYKD